MLAIVLTSCGSGEPPPDSNENQPVIALTVRQGEAVTDLEIVSGLQLALTDAITPVVTISPDLPEGLIFNAQNATINGIAVQTQDPLDYSLTIHTTTNSSQYPLTLAVGEPLPQSFKYLAAGFNAKTIVSEANIPVRMALAPDGRLLSLIHI